LAELYTSSAIVIIHTKYLFIVVTDWLKQTASSTKSATAR